MRKPLAVLLVCGAVVGFSVPQGSAQTDPTVSPSVPCTPFKAIYSEKRWRERNPMRGETPCLAGSRREKAGAQRVKQHFFEYQEYRQIATMKCTGGSEGWFVPNPGSCSTLGCESGFSWHARNPSSGANGAYQLLNHGQPWPIHGFSDRLRHHEIAATLPRSAWVC